MKTEFIVAGGLVVAGAVAATIWTKRRDSRSPLTYDETKAALENSCGNVVWASKHLGVAEKTVHAALNRWPDLRREATAMRRRTSRTGHGRPPRSVACPRRSP